MKRTSWFKLNIQQIINFRDSKYRHIKNDDLILFHIILMHFLKGIRNDVIFLQKLGVDVFFWNILALFRLHFSEIGDPGAIKAIVLVKLYNSNLQKL